MRLRLRDDKVLEQKQNEQRGSDHQPDDEAGVRGLGVPALTTHRSLVVLRLNSALKASNLMRDKDGSVKIVDYGYTVLLHLLLDRITTPGVLSSHALKQFWLAPENLVPISEVEDFRKSDVWGLGATMYELLKGRPLYSEETDDYPDKLVFLIKNGCNCVNL